MECELCEINKDAELTPWRGVIIYMCQKCRDEISTKAQSPLKTVYQKRKQWFIDRIGKRVYRPPVKCNCQSCIDGHTNGILISDKTHADYLHACECELGIRYSDKPLHK